MMSNPNLVFLLAARRTGGTALAKAFKEKGFRLLYDPLNPALLNLAQATNMQSGDWHSKHPKGFTYFEEFRAIDSSFLPKDLIRANTQNIGKSDRQYGEISEYFHHLVDSIGRDLKLCFKIEQVGVYELLRREFPEATFVGITRITEEIIESYLNLYLSSQNFSFFQRDLDYFFANSDPETGAALPPSPEICLEAVKYVSQRHSALVGEICQIQLAVSANSAAVAVKPGFESDEEILHIVHEFSKQVPLVKGGFEPDVILENIGRLVSQRDALVSERDALVSERDALVSERDALVSERDALVSERDALVSSGSRRLMSFLREVFGQGPAREGK